jgi:hypothetical protein
MKDTARGKPIGDVISITNEAAKMSGIVDVSMFVLVVIGVILLARTYLVRMKANKP